MSRRPRAKGSTRRSYLKRFSASVINGSAHTLNKDYVKEANNRANSALFLPPRLYDLFTVNGARPRIEIIKHLQNMTEEVDLEKNILLSESDLRKLYLFFTVIGTRYFFVCVEFHGKRVRKSRIYGSRNRAYQVYDLDPKNLTGIDWVEQHWD